MVLKQRMVLKETVLLTAEVLVALVSDGKPARMPGALMAKLLTED